MFQQFSFNENVGGETISREYKELASILNNPDLMFIKEEIDESLKTNNFIFNEHILTKLNNIFNIYEYYESILINTFPPKIKIINLMNFINYNFNHILPNYKIIIDNSKVIIINSKNMIIIEAIII